MRRVFWLIPLFLLLLIFSSVSADSGIRPEDSFCRSVELDGAKVPLFTSFVVSAYQDSPGEGTEVHSLVSPFCLEPWLGTGIEQSGGTISVLDSSVELQFPGALVFNLEVESDVDIVDVRIHYQVDRMNYAQVTGEAWPDFAPATRVETSWLWDMRKGSLPVGATVTYWWTVKDATGNMVKTSPGTVCFTDPRYRWRSLAEGELTLFWYEGDDSFARELMDACQQGFTRLRSLCYCKAGGSAGAISEPIQIYVYASARDLREAMIFPQEWTGGVAFTEFGIIAIGISPGNAGWGKEALVHELTHLVVHRTTFSPYTNLPIWLDEGLAMYNQGELASSFQACLEQAASEGKLISVQSLCSSFSADPERAYLSYAESYGLVQYLLDNYGQDRMRRLLGLFKAGRTCDGALIEVYGFGGDELDARWQKSLAIPVNQVESVWLHPAVIAVLSALAVSLALAGALALEDWDWRRKGNRVG